jgi:hypothetical protein
MDQGQGQNTQPAGAQAGTAPVRPAVLNDITDTQMEELERQFAEGDRQAWRALTDSYGWTPEQSEEVWNWFGLRPTGYR